MRKTFAFFACAGLLVAAFAAAGCKPRDIRKLVTPYVPSPAPECEIADTLTIGEGDWEDMAQGSTVGAPVTSIEGMNLPYRVFKLVVQDYGPVEFMGTASNGTEYCVEFLVCLGTTCSPKFESEEDFIVCAFSQGSDCCPCTTYLDSYGCTWIDPGTYYFAVVTMTGADVSLGVRYCLD